MPDGPPVRASGCPTQTGPLFAAVGVGKAFTITSREQEEEHPPVLLTVTVRCAVVPVPEAQETWRVPSPAVIVPPTMDHEYVAPVPASGTEAEFPVLAAQTLAGAVIVHTGCPYTAM
jgi:hypothetical protein